jgi:peroxiredoxin
MPKIGDTAPTFTLTAVDGSTYVLSEVLKKRAVLVSFLSSPCKPCEDNIPAIAKIAGRFAREGKAEIIGIVLNGKDGLVKAFDGQQPICRPLLMEDTIVGDCNQTAEAYGVQGTPVFFLVGRNGKILWTHMGRLDQEKAQTAITEALAR